MSGLAFVGGECAEIWGGLGRVGCKGLGIGRLGKMLGRENRKV